VGPISTWNWESESLPEFESGDEVQMEIEILSGSASFDLQILRDGAVHENEILPYGQKSLLVQAII
jgi:hypothetical protein